MLRRCPDEATMQQAPAANPTAFCWPDENGAPAHSGVLQPAGAGARLSARLSASGPSGALVGAKPAQPPRHWRLREAFRVRPLPLALWMTVGLGPLAWAWHSAAVAPVANIVQLQATLKPPSAQAPPAEPQWGEPLRPEPLALQAASAGTGTGMGTGAAEALLAATGSTPHAQNQALPKTANPLPPESAQWGEPLPPYRPEFELRKAIADGLIQPPDTSRRNSGAVVLASQYFRSRAPVEAQPEMVLAQASVRSGTRMRLDSSWRGTRELVDMINPMVAAPRAPAMPVNANATNSGPGRALRIAELPDIVGLPHTLPVDELSPMPPAGVAPMSLQQAIDKGLARNPEVLAAQARMESFRHTQRAALGALLPQADARAAIGVGRSDSAGSAGSVGSSNSADKQRRDGQFSVRQTLLDVPASRELDRQKALAIAAELHWQASVSDVSVDIAGAYMQLLQARIASSLGQRHERQLNRLLTQLNERAGNNPNATVERNRLQARVAQARSQLAESQTTVRAAVTRLASLTGETPQVLGLALPASLNIPADAQAARDEAGRLNRELLAARTEAVATAYEALSHRARMLPKLQAEFSHIRQTNLGGPNGDTRDTRGMLVLNWQLYNGGTDLANQRAAQSREKERGLRADDLKRRIDQDLDIAYGSLHSVGTRFAALREELLAHASVIGSLEQQALAGQRPMLDVLDAYQRLHGSRMELTALVLGEVHSTLRVAQHTGRLGAYSAQPVR